MALVVQGRITTTIMYRIYPPENIESAFDALRNGESLGRNVLAV